MRNRKNICVLAALVLLTGCAAPPEQSAPARKDQQQLIETAGSLEDTGLTIEDQVNAPERWKTAFSDKSGDMTVNVDAGVLVPHAAAAGIIRVKQRDFTQEEADRWTKYLFPGETLYDPAAASERTREELERVLIQYRQELEEADAGEGEAEDSSSRGDFLREEIGNLERAMQTAPEKRVWKELDSKPRTSPHAAESSDLAAAVPDTDGKAMRLLEVHNSPGFQTVSYLNRGDLERRSGGYWDSPLNLSEKDRQYWQDTPEPAITRQEAEETAEDFLYHMGLDESMKAVSADLVMTDPGLSDLLPPFSVSALKCWRIEFARELGGVPVTRVYEQGSSPGDDQWWSYEHPVVYVDDRGVREFWYEGPYEIGETLVENCRLLSFDQISEIFQSFCTAVYEPDLGDLVQEKQTRFDITGVQFGYTRITETNAVFSGLLVPSWTFSGTQTEERVFKDGTRDTWQAPERTLLTINAVDGTVIHLDQGY